MTSNTPNGKLVLRTVAMPENTNAHGHIFGGWLMAQIDLGGSILAQEIALGRVVTVNANQINFIQPAFVGDIICCYARCIKTGKTSITNAIEIWIKRNPNQKGHDVQALDESTIHPIRHKIIDATLTYVSVKTDNTPKPLPKAYQNFDVLKDSPQFEWMNHS